MKVCIVINMLLFLQKDATLNVPAFSFVQLVTFQPGVESISDCGRLKSLGELYHMQNVHS
jgi:hypothetical protein